MNKPYIDMLYAKIQFMSNRNRKPGRKRFPKYFHKKGNSFYIVRTDDSDGSRKWRPLGSDRELALTEYHRLMLAEDAPSPPGNYRSYPHYLLKKSKFSAAGRKIENTLKLTDVQSMWARSGGFCEVSGAPFTSGSQYSINPWGASIDRINSSKPYTPENCRLVCLAANVAMNQWGEDVLITLAHLVVNKQRKSISTKFSKTAGK